MGNSVFSAFRIPHSAFRIPHSAGFQKSNFNPTRSVLGLTVRRGVRKSPRPAAPKLTNSEPKLKTVALNGLKAST